MKSVGFIINPYSGFISNSIIYNNQCKIARYNNDNMLSHVKSHVEEKVSIKIIRQMYEHFGELTV